MPVVESIGNDDDGPSGGSSVEMNVVADSQLESTDADDATAANDVALDDDDDDSSALLQAGDNHDLEQTKDDDRRAANTKDSSAAPIAGDDELASTIADDQTRPATGKENGHDLDRVEAETVNGGGGGGGDDENDGWVDVIGSGDLMKKVMRKGAGVNSRPVRGDLVRLNVAGQLEDGRQVELGRDVEMTLGDAEAIQGLDLVIPLMELNEIAKVIVKPRLAYGKLGREPDIPPNATITYMIELIAVSDEPDANGLPYPLRTQIGNRKRERGNFWFGRGEYSCALQCYRKALQFLDDESELSTEMPLDLKVLLENRIKVYNNMAAAQLKIGALDAALKSVDNVLKVQPVNVKALFRKGKILELMGETVEAISTLKEALKLEPEAKIIHHELSKLAEKQKAEEKTERELYRRMLGQDKRLESNDTNDTARRRRSSVYGFVRWGFVAGGLAVGLVGVALYRHFHGI